MKTIQEKIHPDHPKINHNWGVEVQTRTGGPGPMWSLGLTYKTREEAEKEVKKIKEDNNGFIGARLCKYESSSNQI